MKNLILYITIASLACSITLQEAYDNAEPENGYDKYVILEPNQIYEGGLGMFEGNTYINCQGSTIDLLGGGGIWLFADDYYNATLDIEYCTIFDGETYGLNYMGTSSGSVSNCNFILNDIGLVLMDYSHVSLKNSNFIDNHTYGLGIISEEPVLHATYSNFWNNSEGDCMENCPGWGSIWTPWEPEPGTGIIYENPLFENLNNLDLNLTDNSPCIDAGNPDDLDPDNSIRDIGALIFSSYELGDCSQDNNLNILDVIFIINNCIFENESICQECSDIDGNNTINVLDIISLINIILQID